MYLQSFLARCVPHPSARSRPLFASLACASPPTTEAEALSWAWPGPGHARSRCVGRMALPRSLGRVRRIAGAAATAFGAARAHSSALTPRSGRQFRRLQDKILLFKNILCDYCLGQLCLCALRRSSQWRTQLKQRRSQLLLDRGLSLRLRLRPPLARGSLRRRPLLDLRAASKID